MMFSNINLNATTSPHTINAENECFFLSARLERDNLLFTVDVLFCLLNSIFTMAAVMGNTVVIAAIWRTPSLHSPSVSLLGCLALSDLVVGIVVQPCAVAYRAARLTGNFDIYCTFGIITEISGWVSSGVSFLTLTAIGVERYLALYLHLRYKAVVTNSRVFAVFTCFWIFYGVFSVTHFWFSRRNFMIIAASILVICVITTCWGYLKIFKLVKYHHTQIAGEARRASHIHGESCSNLDLHKYKRSVVTTGLVVAIYIICYLPLLGAMSANIRFGYTITVEAAYIASAAIVFMNSTFNFVIYCWRMKDIRKAVLKVLQNPLGTSSQ